MKKFVLIATVLMGLAAVLAASSAPKTVVAECNSRACAPVLPAPIKG